MITVQCVPALAVCVRVCVSVCLRWAFVALGHAGGLRQAVFKSRVHLGVPRRRGGAAWEAGQQAAGAWGAAVRVRCAAPVGRGAIAGVSGAVFCAFVKVVQRHPPQDGVDYVTLADVEGDIIIIINN